MVIAKTDKSLSILAILADVELQSALRLILRQSKWAVEIVAGLEDGVTVLRSSEVGVVVTQRQLPARRCWKDVLRETQKLSPPARLVVTDRLADDSLWAEVLNLGGYDLLAQPLDPQEVFHVLSLAWRSWNEDRKRIQAKAIASVTRFGAAIPERSAKLHARHDWR